MTMLPTNEADFNIPFELVYEDALTDLYAPLHLAIRDALGLGADVAPKYTSAGAVEDRPLIKGTLYKGFGRINGVTGTPYEGGKAASVSYSAIWASPHGKIVRWSTDLDDSPHGHKKPATLWFRQDGQPVMLTDALKASVKALAPRKTRSPKATP